MSCKDHFSDYQVRKPAKPKKRKKAKKEVVFIDIEGKEPIIKVGDNPPEPLWDFFPYSIL